MILTTAVNLRKESYDIYIGRGSKWGNPYSHKPSSFPDVTTVASREVAIERYREYIQNRPDLIAALHELKGKRLGCFCKPLDCHGDVLIELIRFYLGDD